MQICLYKGAQINPYVKYHRGSHAVLHKLVTQSKKGKKLLWQKLKPWMGKKSPTQSQDYFKSAPNAPVAHKPQVMCLWITVLYLPREQYKNKGKLLEIYTVFQSCCSSGKPAVWEDPSKVLWETIFVSTTLVAMPWEFKKYSVNKTNWKTGRMVSGKCP